MAKKHLRRGESGMTECGREIKFARADSGKVPSTQLTDPANTAEDVCRWCRTTYDSYKGGGR